MLICGVSIVFAGVVVGIRCSYKLSWSCSLIVFFFFFQAEDGIRDLVRSRGLGDVYKRQILTEY